MKKFRKTLSLALAVLMCTTLFSVLPVSAAEKQQSLSDPNGILNSINDTDKREYIATMCDYYIKSSPELTEAMNTGKRTVVLIFEGGSDSTSPYVEYSGVRDQAVAIVVSGWKYIAIDKNSSTIPDHPHKAYYTLPSSATVNDGIYALKTAVPSNSNSRLNVRTLDGLNKISCTRMDAAAEKFVSLPYATDIQIHSRSTNISGSKTCTSPYSTGCILVGTSNNNSYYCFQESARSAAGMSATDIGYLVLDRMLASESLKDIYEYEGTVEKITEFSYAANVACGLIEPEEKEEPKEEPEEELTEVENPENDSELMISINQIGEIESGQPYNITGYVSSNYDIVKITGKLMSGDNVLQSAQQDFCTTYQKIVTTDINRNLKFGVLDAGSYKLVITAKDESGKTVTESVSFTIYDEVEEPSEQEEPTVVEEPSEQEEPTEVEEPSEQEEPTEVEEPSEQEEPTVVEEPSEQEEPTEPEEPAEQEEPIEVEDPENDSELMLSIDQIGDLESGFPHDITGYVSSNYDIVKITGKLMSGNTALQSVEQDFYTTYQNIALTNINKKLLFGVLDAGSYQLVITAKDESGKTASVSIPFTIYDVDVESNIKITFGEMNWAYRGAYNVFYGKVNSARKLNYVKGEVLLNGEVLREGVVNTRLKTYNIASDELNEQLDFGTLPVGIYTYRVSAEDDKGFKSENSEEIIVITAASASTLSGAVTALNTISRVNPYTLSGKFTSNNLITKVTVDIVLGSRDLQSAVVTPYTTTYDLSDPKLNSQLDFTKLESGSYSLRVIAYEANGKSVERTQHFNVTAPASTIAISAGRIGTVNYNTDATVTGTVKSNYSINNVIAEIILGSTVKQSVEAAPMACEYNLDNSEINDGLDFASLAAGTYTLRIKATDNSNSIIVDSQTVTVKPQIIESNLNMTLDDIGIVRKGSAHNITGYVSSNAMITKVTGQILKGTSVIQTVTENVNTDYYNIVEGTVNNNLRFGTLAVGDYTLKISATDYTGKTVEKTVDFKVKGTIASSTLGAYINYIGTVNAGTKYTVSGGVYSNYAITGIKAEILRDGSPVQTATTAPNKTSIYLNDNSIASQLDISALPVGQYTFSVTAVDDTDKTVTVTSNFTIKGAASNLTGYLNSISAFTAGTYRDVTGKFTSNYNITKLTAEYILSGKVVATVTENPMSKSVDLVNSGINDINTMKKLAKGYYNLRVTAVDESGKTLVRTIGFTVNAAVEPSAITFKLDNIGTATYGCSKNITGTITSVYNLSTIKGEILMNGTVKQTATAYTSAKSVNIRSTAVNSNLRFAKLQRGTYTLRITVKDCKGYSDVYNMTFVVK